MGHADGYARIAGDRKIPRDTPDGWVERYVSLRAALGFSTRGLEGMLRSLVRFMRERGARSFRDLSGDQAAAWITARHVQEATVSARLAVMRGFFRYLLSLGQVDSNVWSGIAYPRIRPFRAYIFALEELRAFFSYAYGKIRSSRPCDARIHAAFRSPEVVARTCEAVRVKAVEEEERLVRRKAELERRIEELKKAASALISSAGNGPRGRVAIGEELGRVNVGIGEAEGLFEAVTSELAGLHKSALAEDDVIRALRDVDPAWDELFPLEQQRVVRLLVEKVDVYSDRLDVHFRTDGLHSLVAEVGGIAETALERSATACAR